MTQQQHTDYQFLWTLALQKDKTIKEFSIICLEMGTDVEQFINADTNYRYVSIIQVEQPSISDDSISLPGIFSEPNIINISPAGKSYLKWLEMQREDELLNKKIKEITIEQSNEQKKSTRIQTIITFASLGVAILAALSGIIVPFIIRQLDKDKVEQVSIEQLKDQQTRMLNIEESLRDVQQNVQKKDTAIVKIVPLTNK